MSKITSELYLGIGRVRGKCSKCGDDSIHYHQGTGKNKNKQYPTPYYYTVMQKTDWFRGNDISIGKFCKVHAKELVKL